MLYKLFSKSELQHGVFKLKNNDDKIVQKVYLWERDKKEYQIPPIKAEFEALMDYTVEHIKEADFFDIFGIPVFSHKVYTLLKDILKEDLDFFPCDMYCKTEVIEFYIGRLKTKRAIIDRDKSTYQEFEGVKFLLSVVYKSSLEEDFYIATDIDNNRYLVTDKFAELIEQHDLKMYVTPAPTELKHVL
jgi:hypothetical protein